MMMDHAPSTELQPAPLFTPTPQAAKRMLEFFTAQNITFATPMSCPIPNFAKG